jgi:hypothetical protein
MTTYSLIVVSRVRRHPTPESVISVDDQEQFAAVGGALSPTSHIMLRDTQKESHTLRRHVVTLNNQLEHAETKLKAQRIELERAAERMEKDRARHKEDQ